MINYETVEKKGVSVAEDERHKSMRFCNTGDEFGYIRG